MSRGVRLLLVGFLLAALAGCGRYFFVQREAWRKDAELACLKSGAIKESATLVRTEPINGPGVCGADYPLKVVALGEINTALGYAENLRPPGAIPGHGTSSPAWPPDMRGSNGNVSARPAPRLSAPETYAPGRTQSSAGALPAPLSIVPPGAESIEPPRGGHAISTSRSAPAPMGRRPSVYDPPPPDEEDDVADTPTRMPASRTQPAAPRPQSVPLSPRRSYSGPVGPVEIKPAATLACPIVSALDRWIAHAVQPAALRWFGQPVTEIRQISAYSCRGMNAQPGARISEHAFGNALDISSFTLADGRRITVKNGWRGSPEEQGFLRDIQAAACEQFTTVLAPGSNRFHYDHIHVDLMRRSSGRSICNPDAVPGEVIAARAMRERGYAAGAVPGITGSIGRTKAAKAAGEARKPKLKSLFRPSEDDDDWIEDDGPRGRDD
jgi:hypothetical protein